MSSADADPSSAAMQGPFAGLRVVEFGEGVAAPYVAKLLGDFGADVVKVEGPTGDPTRLRGPFPDDEPDPEASGLFLYLNTNKRGVALDPDDPAGQAALATLLVAADIFVTSLPLSRLAAAGASPAVLRERHPSLIITIVTPFGTDGSRAGWRSDDIVTSAMGAIAYSTPGIPDAATDLYAEPPLHAGCFAAGTIAGIVAANATVAALRSRAAGGQGCLVEVSEQAAVATMQQRDIANASYIGGTHKRIFSSTTTGRMPNFYLPCKDGWVAIPAPLEDQWQRLVQGMGSPEWTSTPAFASGAARTANCIELQRRMTEWTMTVTSDELYRIAQDLQLLVFPFHSVRRMLASPQVESRGSVVDFELGSRAARMPAAPVNLRGSPWSMRRRAPRRGEHTAAMMQAWAREARPAAPAAVPAAGAVDGAASDTRTLPLAGVRVLDLGQFIAVPFCTLWLAWLGAEVISVESRRRMTSRTAPPFAPGLRGDPDASGYYNLLYSAKKSVTLDMTTPAGRDLARRLAGVVDVMVDNYATGVLEKFGLGYETIVKDNPRLVALSCGAFGRSGPMKAARGLHSAVNLFSGVADVTGYRNGAPRILGGCLPDPFSGTYAGFAIMAALHHRDRTGRGQFIDLAMYEAMMTLIPEAVIDLTANDRDPVRQGSRDRAKAPHGIYRCRDEDTWVAISVDGDRDWAAWCRATGNTALASDVHFATAGARCANADALDARVAAWTSTRSAAEAAQALQAHGVAAGPVLRSDQLIDDESLVNLGAVISTDHPKAGVRRQLGLPWRMDSARFAYRRAPLLGEHTQEILTTLLGVDEAEFARLEADGVLN
jgi:crotonobetainyl-CoA:carnitine CoA-transferase CaiB-like acyl-CoA transferase